MPSKEYRSGSIAQFVYVIAGCTLLTLIAGAEEYPFDSDQWDIAGEEVEFVDYKGQEALRLRAAAATLKALAIEDGVIEFDIAVSAARGFAGGKFREVDSRNFEHFYIRPHQSGNPDANQYNPVFDGVSAWQLYYGEAYAAPVAYTFNDWMHIRIVFAGQRADIYIDSDTPVLQVPELKRAAAAGSVGVDASPFAEAYFANFSVSPLPDDYRFAEAAVPRNESAGIVRSWLVSDTFDSQEIEHVDSLASEFKAARSWTKLDAEPTGITNLARLGGVGDGSNTAIANVVINSDSDQYKGLAFGYSDRVSVYLNGERIYSGSNFYESRDYRYLGTVGLFDKVHLPLKEGRNEVWFAVSEAFGGWGILAEFDDTDGITVFEN